MRWAAPLLVAVLFLAACGGGGKTASCAQKDPGEKMVCNLVAAAKAGSAPELWSLLSAPTRARYGSPGQAARALERTLAPYRQRGYRLSVSERITDRFGVVAISGQDGGALALPLRLEQGTWKVELGGPVQIQHLGLPVPGGRGTNVVQLAVEVKSPAHDVDAAVIYLDGQSVLSTGHGSPNDETILANLPGPIPKGRHVAVAFASAGGNASAFAWSFTAVR